MMEKGRREEEAGRMRRWIKEDERMERGKARRVRKEIKEDVRTGK